MDHQRCRKCDEVHPCACKLVECIEPSCGMVFFAVGTDLSYKRCARCRQKKRGEQPEESDLTGWKRLKSMAGDDSQWDEEYQTAYEMYRNLNAAHKQKNIWFSGYYSIVADPGICGFKRALLVAKNVRKLGLINFEYDTSLSFPRRIKCR
ncbi:hypothetical protein VNI00_014036 [Paramarasmius palmivorus]|uniref:Uncharacterized protein n=1 Tax=Paramarasmius palmivorus TaxID=297713 RepID=A0AAW0BUE0_9AGAR